MEKISKGLISEISKVLAPIREKYIKSHGPLYADNLILQAAYGLLSSHISFMALNCRQGRMTDEEFKTASKKIQFSIVKLIQDIMSEYITDGGTLILDKEPK